MNIDDDVMIKMYIDYYTKYAIELVDSEKNLCNR